MIEGSVLRAENSVRITAQLVASRPERHLWANSYERDLRDILALQGELARTIAREIEIILTPEEEAQIDKKPTENLSAYEDYLNGRYYWAKRTREDTWKAVEFYEAAIAKDSTYALAYSGIADCYVVDAGRLLGVTVNESRLKARTFALRALELDSTLAEPHSVLAQILWHLDWDFLSADEEFTQALRLNPNDVTSLRRYAYGLVAMGRGEEAIQRIRQAYRLDPLSFITNLDMCALLYMTRHYTGISRDPEMRLDYHNNGHKGWTRRGRPWVLVFSRKFANMSLALGAEQFVKAQKSSNFIKKLISGESTFDL